MSTRVPRFTNRVTIPMHQETVEALDDAAMALGITRTEALREATYNWLTHYHLPTNYAETMYPEWVESILSDEALSNDEKMCKIFEITKDAPITQQDQRMIDRELHRQRIDWSRRHRAGLV